MDQNGMLANILRMVGARRQQEQAAPPPPDPKTLAQDPRSTAGMLNGANRQKYTEYAIDAQSNGQQPLPYAEWAKMQAAP